MQLDEGGPWGAVCGDGWGVREAMVSSHIKYYLENYFVRKPEDCLYFIVLKRMN